MSNTFTGLAPELLEQWEGLLARAGDGPVRALAAWNGVVIWDSEVNPVDLARAYVHQAAKESCGQCFPCRLGTQRLTQIMNRICDGQGRENDLARLEEVALNVSATARCDVGQTLAKPLLDLLRTHLAAFRSAVREHRKIEPGRYQAVVTAPCMAACPSSVNIPAYLEGVRLGRFAQALEQVRQDCPMPGTIGRVCVRPCESACRRGLLDQALAIKDVKRFLADYEVAQGQEPPARPGPAQEAKVAVVGAGPAGLSCAYYLGKLGYRATIFEAQEGPGGMAAYGIPSYRLPREVLGYEVSQVEKLGAEIKYGVNVGQDVSLEELGQQGYQAIFLAMGAPEASSMRCEGEDAGYHCFMTGVEFLSQAARGQKPLEGDKILVIGGGNVAMDCVRTARRLGFDDVNLLYRRTEAEMPADPQEITEAQEEGVVFHYLVAPLSILAQDGKVTGLKCQRMALGEPDASGRRRPEPVEGSEFVIECDAIIPAVGQICVVDCVLPHEDSLTKWKTLVVDELTFQSKQPHVFGGGDCATGPNTLIAALAAGKKAAKFIDHYLQDGSTVPDTRDVLDELIKQTGVFDPDEKFPYPGVTHRAHAPSLPPETRINDFAEVEGGLTRLQAQHEASRCLRCYRIMLAAV